MYKVERAIIMAAGLGNRMKPVTLKIPKPLVRVNGVRMIDTVIDGLHKNGYLKEQFQTLEEEYPGLKLIDNPWYDTCNNIASLYVAREHLENAIILDGDQIIYHPEILAPEFERSGYNSVWTDDETDEWLQTVENGIVTGCSRTGGKGGWQLYSISRWTAEDGKRLKGHLEQEFEVKKNRQIYWDDVAMFCYPKEYQLGIRPMKAEDIIEVDNFSELVALDASYAHAGASGADRCSMYRIFLCTGAVESGTWPDSISVWRHLWNVLPGHRTWHFLSVSVSGRLQIRKYCAWKAG